MMNKKDAVDSFLKTSVCDLFYSLMGKLVDEKENEIGIGKLKSPDPDFVLGVHF